MANFTAKDVQSLRQSTGAGMMDCKAALVEADGDIERAAVVLREKGLAAAAKKAGRVAAEGVVFAAVGKNGAAGVLEVNSETDFSAKTENFTEFVNGVLSVVIEKQPRDLDALLAEKYPGSDLTVAETLREKVLVIGENLQIRRFAYFEKPYNAAYIHMGGKIGVIAHLDVEGIDTGNAELAELAKDICLQAAAMRPTALSRDDVDPAVIEEEKKIYVAQLVGEGKPENIAEKAALGRVNKYFQENCLIEQAFFKEETLTIKQLIEQKAKALGGTIKLTGYSRFEKGEGIQKKEDNFAEEVANMVK